MKLSHLLLASGFVLLWLSACRGKNPERAGNSAARSQSKAAVGEQSGTGAGVRTKFSASEMQAMTLGDLQLLAEERQSQDQAETRELALLEVINPALCALLTARTNTCLVQRKLGGAEKNTYLQCDGTYGPLAKGEEELSITLPPGVAGAFVLLIDDTYVSNEFSSGTTPLTFTELAAEGAPSAGPIPTAPSRVIPSLAQIGKIALRSSPHGPREKLKKLPNLPGFSLKLSIAGQALPHATLLPSNDGQLRARQLEYLLDLKPFIAANRSPPCTLSPSALQAEKDQATKMVEATLGKGSSGQDPSLRETLRGVSESPETRQKLIATVNSLQAQIEKRFARLATARNRQYKIAQELTSGSELGCHANAPITSFAVEVDGKIAGRSLVGEFEQPLSGPPGGGKASEIKFDFGGFSFVVDLEKENLFGGRYTPARELASGKTIASIDRIMVAKLGVGYDNERSCRTKYIFISEECIYTSYETQLLAIDALRFYVNGRLFYQAENLGIQLSRKRMEVVFTDLLSNQSWVQLMQATDCTDVR